MRHERVIESITQILKNSRNTIMGSLTKILPFFFWMAFLVSWENLPFGPPVYG